MTPSGPVCGGPRSLANVDQPTVLVKTQLKRMQYRPGLLKGFLAKSGPTSHSHDLHNGRSLKASTGVLRADYSHPS